MDFIGCIENHTTIFRLSPIQATQGSFRPSSGTALYAPDANSQLLFDMRGMTDASTEMLNSLVDPSGKRRWAECVRLIAEEQVNGGYIVVLPTGEVLCYHASDREQFRDYLFRNTYIEYVSCKKYRWGFVEKDSQGRFVLPVNAAVRFFKSPVFAGDPSIRLETTRL